MPRSFPRLTLSRTMAAAALTLACALTGCGETDAKRAETPASPPPTSSGRPASVTPAAMTDKPTPPAAPAADDEKAMQNTTKEQAMFGGGCFWGVEHIFAHQIPGVTDAVSGFSGGHVADPTYKQVCYEDTGHVEVVLVTFDPSKTTYEKIADAFFRMHDPTQGNRQGPDVGEQYRSVIYYFSPEQKKTAEAVKARYAAKFKDPITTTIEPAGPFYKAEAYHQDYYQRNGKTPYCHTLRPE